MTTSTTAIVDTIPVATSTGSMEASHTGLGVYEYSFSIHGNTIGVSMHREPFSYTPWGFPEHGGFPASHRVYVIQLIIREQCITIWFHA